MLKLGKKIWGKYLMLCSRSIYLAIPMINRLAGVGRVWCHPMFFRHNWVDDPDCVFVRLASLLRQGGTFLDVGANIGLTSIIGSRTVGPGGRVIAFEPATRNLAILKRHLRWNCFRNYEVVPKCIGNRIGTVDFSLLDGGLHTSNSITFSRISEAAYVENKSITVIAPITTLDDYCDTNDLQPDLIKIDVEGAELEVLLGAAKTIQKFHPTLIIGLHPFWWPDGQDPEALTAFLTAMDYRWETTKGESSPLNIYSDFVCIPIQRST